MVQSPGDVGDRPGLTVAGGMRAGAEPALGKLKVFFGPETPPLNLVGGYRFTGVPGIDLAGPQFTPATVFDRVPEHIADHEEAA
jgi:hypothetical protein